MIDRIFTASVMALSACLLWVTLFVPQYGLAAGTLIALPWLTLAAAKMSHGHSRGIKVDAQTGLPFAFPFAFYPAVLAMVRVVFDFPMHDRLPAGAIAAGIAGLLVLFVRLMQPRRPTGTEQPRPDEARPRPSRLLLLFVFALVYGYGATVFADAYDDPDIVQTHSVQVTGKSVTTYKKTATRWIDLAPSPLSPDGARQDVPDDIYEAVKTGDKVCIDEHAGRLGMRWTRMHPCDRPAPVASTALLR